VQLLNDLCLPQVFLGQLLKLCHQLVDQRSAFRVGDQGQLDRTWHGWDSDDAGMFSSGTLTEQVGGV